MLPVPPDIQEFLDQWSSDIVSHDVENIMTYYSDKYLDSGETKIAVEKIGYLGLIPFSPLRLPSPILCQKVTEFTSQDTPA